MLYYMPVGTPPLPKSKPKLTGKQYDSQLDVTYFRNLEILGPHIQIHKEKSI